MIVDGVMQERVTTSFLLYVRCRSASEHAVPAAVGDPALLFDVDVHELARRNDFIADRPRFVDGDHGSPIQVRK